MGLADIAAGVDVLRDNSIPNYYYPERAIATLSAVLSYIDYRKEPAKTFETFSARSATVRQIFKETRAKGRRDLPDIQASQVTSAYGIRIAKSALAHNIDEAKRIASHLGYPLALKIASPDILHKSDVGGLAIGIENEEQLVVKYNQVIDNVSRFMPQAMIWGISVQEMIQEARETIIGVNKDPQFGHLILFGLGGIYVEVLKDVSFRIAPVSREDARQMVAEINTYALLRGVRGQPSADIDAVVDTIQRVSQMVTDFPDIIEMDINPLMVLEKGKGAIAADVRITIGE
jgi:acetyltransferase